MFYKVSFSFPTEPAAYPNSDMQFPARVSPASIIAQFAAVFNITKWVVYLNLPVTGTIYKPLAIVR